MDPMGMMGQGLVGIWCSLLSWMDLRSRRLPNTWVLGGAGVALVFRFGVGGWPCAVDGFAAGMVAGGLLLLPFLMNASGGGDVKMLFAAGVIAGWRGLPALLMGMALVGWVAAIGMLICRKRSAARILHGIRCLVDCRYDREAGVERIPPKSDECVRMPFGPAISMGLMFAVLCTW